MQCLQTIQSADQQDGFPQNCVMLFNGGWAVLDTLDSLIHSLKKLGVNFQVFLEHVSPSVSNYLVVLVILVWFWVILETTFCNSEYDYQPLKIMSLWVLRNYFDYVIIREALTNHMWLYFPIIILAHRLFKEFLFIHYCNLDPVFVLWMEILWVILLLFMDKWMTVHYINIFNLM